MLIIERVASKLNFSDSEDIICIGDEREKSLYSIKKFEEKFGELPEEIKDKCGKVFIENNKEYKEPEERYVWKSYFDHNFGVMIDSPMKLREIEKKQGGAYYSIEEFKKINVFSLNPYNEISPSPSLLYRFNSNSNSANFFSNVSILFNKELFPSFSFGNSLNIPFVLGLPAI